MVESLASNDPGTQKRRSTRIVQAMPITVTGVDALGQPFKERTTTVMVNCHGCKYQSKHYVPKNMIVTLEIPRPEPAFPARSVSGRVVWVQRPRTVRELFQIGLEFEIAGNVWGIAFPPEDWFPCPDDVSAARPAKHADAGEAANPEFLEESAAQEASSHERSSSESGIHVVSPPLQQEGQLAMARQLAKMVAEAKELLDKSTRKGAHAAINDEMTVVRQQLDAQLHDAVEKAIKVSMDRVSESAVKKVVQQAADRTAALIDEARRAGESGAERLDAKVRDAVQEAIGSAVEQAAQKAAEQTAAQNWKQTVEEAVDRALSQKEVSTPSLEILSSPEAAQKHLEQWKSGLEDAARGVRRQTIEQSQTDAAAARQHWQEEFQSAVDGASRKIGDTLSEVSRAALAQAEQDMSARSLSLRSSLDEAIASAQDRIQSLGSGLEQERARTEETRNELQQAARETLDATRHRLDEMLAGQYQEIGRKADDAIAERANQLQPILENSAQKVLDHFSGELDEKLGAKLEQARKAAADLAEIEQQTAAARSGILSQLEQASATASHLGDSIRQQVREAANEAAKLQGAAVQQVQRASQEAVQSSLDRMKQEIAKYPTDFQESCREAISKVEQELDQKSTEAQHETYEALQKAADWYQKKAQTTMQSALEKAVEHSSATLRDRAAEISSLVAAELDHYRRSYVDHSRAQIEEAAAEVMDREHGRLGKAAELAGANFAQRVQQTTGESLVRFEQASRQALEKARSDMEFDREGSLAAFQQMLERKMQDGIEQASLQLQSQLGPLVEAWEEQRKAERREWAEQMKKSAEESVEQYKARLENASNSWLLASATTLGQHSQAVLDTLAKSAEKRMRETCSQVLAGMGDTLKQRLLGMSDELGGDEEDDPPSPRNPRK